MSQTKVIRNNKLFQNEFFSSFIFLLKDISKRLDKLRVLISSRQELDSFFDFKDIQPLFERYKDKKPVKQRKKMLPHVKSPGMKRLT